MIGIPLKEFELCNPDGNCDWVNEHLIEFFVNSGYKFTGNKRMTYALPDKINDKSENGILILDDYTRADSRFLQACMTLIETQSYYSWKLPKGWTIILTTNPDSGEYSVNSLDAAQQSRFFNYSLTFNKECWARWAEFNKVDGRLINFIMLNPELLTGTNLKDQKAHNKAVNPRAVVNFGKAIKYIPEFSSSTSLSLIMRRGEASVGAEFTSLFESFVTNRLDKLPSPDFMLHNGWETVEKTIKDVVGNQENQTYRADIGSVLTSRIINYSLYYAEKNPIDDKFITRLKNLTSNDLFLKDLEYMIIREIFVNNKTKFKKLSLDPKIQDMLLV